MRTPSTSTEPSLFDPKPRLMNASRVPPSVLVCVTPLMLPSTSSSERACWSCITLLLTTATDCGISFSARASPPAMLVVRG